MALGQDTPENRRAFLESLAKGVTQSIAAPANFGVTYQTVKTWRDKDPEFEMQVKAARARFAQKHIENIDAWAERDWKASKYLLEVSPETEATFGQRTKGPSKLEVIININRESPGVTINGKTSEQVGQGDPTLIDVTPE